MHDFFKAVEAQICLPYFYERAAELGHVWNPKISDDEQFNPFGQTNTRHVVGQLFSGASVERIIWANMKWHAHFNLMQDRTSSASLDEPREWVALVNPFVTPGGVSVRCLTSNTELADEGKEQDHCVRGYAYNCLYKDSHILTLTGEAQAWRSTLELKLPEDGKVAIGQHKFHGNADPNAAAREAALFIVDGINNKTILTNASEIDVQKRIRKEEMLKNRHEELLVRTGFDPMDRLARDNAFETWHHMQRGLFPMPQRRDYLDQELAPYIEEQVARYESIIDFRASRLQAG